MRARGKRSPNERQSRKAIHPVDIHVASRLRERRIVLGIVSKNSQQPWGLAFNRFTNKNGGQTVSAPAASMTLSKVLGVPVAFFFEDIADTSTPAAAPLASGEHNDPLGRREAAEFSLHTAPYQTRWYVAAYDNLQNLFRRGRTVRAQQQPAPSAADRRVVCAPIGAAARRSDKQTCRQPALAIANAMPA
jgi:hypothetical protein